MPDNSRHTAGPMRRYLTVTAIATPSNSVLFAALLASDRLPPVLCNLLAASVVCVPTFVACERWVWRDTPARQGRALSFWVSTIVNVGIATACVGLARSLGLGRAALAVVPVVAYSALWGLRFLWLDRRLYRREIA